MCSTVNVDSELKNLISTLSLKFTNPRDEYVGQEYGKNSNSRPVSKEEKTVDNLWSSAFSQPFLIYNNKWNKTPTL